MRFPIESGVLSKFIFTFTHVSPLVIGKLTYCGFLVSSEALLVGAPWFMTTVMESAVLQMQTPRMCSLSCQTTSSSRLISRLGTSSHSQFPVRSACYSLRFDFHRTGILYARGTGNAIGDWSTSATTTVGQNDEYHYESFTAEMSAVNSYPNV